MRMCQTGNRVLNGDIIHSDILEILDRPKSPNLCQRHGYNFVASDPTLEMTIYPLVMEHQ